VDDADLVRRMLAGDERAFDEFFEAYFDRVFRFAVSRTRDEDAAEEVTQATLVCAVRRLETWRGEAALFTWLCSICRRELMAHTSWVRRGGTAHPGGHRTAESGTLERLPAPGDGPERELQRQEVSQLVQLALDDLPERYGDVLQWKYIDGQAVSEIASRLGSTPKAVESLLTRARQAFRAGFTELTRSTESS
jgi:RNA polymerase sigma-70 factor (ECF subfamily)